MREAVVFASQREQLANGALAVRKAIEYALQIAQGLGTAQGIVQRDLKPQNILQGRKVHWSPKSCIQSLS